MPICIRVLLKTILNTFVVVLGRGGNHQNWFVRKEQNLRKEQIRKGLIWLQKKNPRTNRTFLSGDSLEIWVGPDWIYQGITENIQRLCSK